MADPSFGTIASNTGASGTSIVVNKPASTADGDLMLMTLATATGGNIITAANSGLTGWTLVNSTQSDTYGGYGTWRATYSKIAASEGASYTVGYDHTFESADIAISRIINPKSGGAWLGNTAQNNGTGATTTFSAVTATSGSLIFGSANDWNWAGSLTAPSTTTERYDNFHYVWTKAGVGAGTTGSFTMTNSNGASDVWRSHTIEVLTDAAAVVIPPKSKIITRQSLVRANHW